MLPPCAFETAVQAARKITGRMIEKSIQSTAWIRYCAAACICATSSCW
jgi:hypothetical protein